MNELFDLTKDTYYLTVKHDSNFYYYGNYSFKVDFTSAGESFTETGSGNDNTISTANPINLNTSYNGQIAFNDYKGNIDKDFYKFTMPSSGRIVLSATAKIKYICYSIYDSAGNELWKTSPSWNSTTEMITTSENIDLTKGTYYFAAKRHDNYNYFGNYSFKLNFTSAGESFTETGSGSDNAISTANPINLNTSYNGQIAINDEKDFYRFSLGSETKIHLTTSANMNWIACYIYDSSGNEVWKKNFSWNSTTQEISASADIDLSAGTYYLCMKTYNSSKGNYSFSLSTVSNAQNLASSSSNSAQNPASSSANNTQTSTSASSNNAQVSVSKPAVVKTITATAKKKSLVIKWKKVSKATGYRIIYSTSKKFTKKKVIYTTKKTVTLKKLKSKKRYYIKINAYKVVNGKRIYGKNSKVIMKKTK